MLEPQSTFLFILLVIIFAALMWWMIRTRRAALRVVAAFVAFVVAVQFGVMAVNRYFDYYQTWGAAFADLTNAPPAKSQPTVPVNTLVAKSWRSVLLGHTVFSALARREGYTFEVSVPGPLSHITRNVWIYLPPQYFQPAYKNYRFPAIELIHGQPGEPQDWINVVGVTSILESLVNSGKAKPAILVMPDANGGVSISLQCLNSFHGPQDMTYLGLDVPNEVSRQIPRVQPPGPGWGIAGYSEGGFCAANMALQPDLRRRYAAAASLSGYFIPLDNQLADGKFVNPFAHNQALKRANSPVYEIQALTPGTNIPEFWLGAGLGDQQDVQAARYFQEELQIYQADVPLMLLPGGHSMAVWRAEVPPMLEWMTNLLAMNVNKMMEIIRLADQRARKCSGLPGSSKNDPAGKTSPTSFASPSPTSSATISPFCRQKPPGPTKRPAKKPQVKIKSVGGTKA